ncbi:unnamed protein product [Vitrella brassicaformis CCMP3155]|uniref:Kazal-like domain-containing protein n=2 Tax=Vitrella brassicaformis TaxID=1169539 RepID=A0A0G4GYM2_VITBC|nr:unnamed protein product [Vitrella brassicaformis CCMP3155]|mmetsp:Transcript_17522/g.42095  ORF Transcript_17522/g.42095 Transcript_17522/m.42095 type:complete len:170 (+) Transcript_17522:308-817(+)|eukprot:CEM36235.1 unnamed protein product [Vitrella brassicaformis CCMP3155]
MGVFRAAVVSLITNALLVGAAVLQVPPPHDAHRCEWTCLDTTGLMAVCGSDGQTYPSVCAMEQQSCRNALQGITQVTLAADHPCSDDTHRDVCGSFECLDTSGFNKVCGSDGRTYTSPCHLERAQCRSPSLSVRSHGPCASVAAARRSLDRKEWRIFTALSRFTSRNGR